MRNRLARMLGMGFVISLMTVLYSTGAEEECIIELNDVHITLDKNVVTVGEDIDCKATCEYTLTLPDGWKEEDENGEGDVVVKKYYTWTWDGGDARKMQDESDKTDGAYYKVRYSTTGYKSLSVTCRVELYLNDPPWYSWDNFLVWDGPMSAYTTVLVVKVDLDTDSNNNGSIDSTDYNEDKYEMDNPGVIVCRDANGISLNQEDYREMKLRLYPSNLSSGSLTLSSQNGRVSVWQASNGTSPINLGTSGNIPISPVPSSLWIDGISIGSDMLTLEYRDSSGKLIDSDTIALNVVDTISFSPSGTFVYSWSPVHYDGGAGLPSVARDVILYEVGNNGWDVTTVTFEDSVDDDNYGTCTYANLLLMKYGGIVVVDGHGIPTPSVAAQVLQTQSSAESWDGAGQVEGVTVAFSDTYQRYIVKVSNTWFNNNWKSMRDFVNGITVFLVCHGGEGWQEGSPVGNAGGRIMLGYDGTITDSLAEMDMLVFFSRLNGSLGDGNMRTAGKAYDGGFEYNENLRMYGDVWTTLGPSPSLVGKTGLHNYSGSAAIVFDTFMDSSVSANYAVFFTSGTGSSRGWFGLSGHMFGITCGLTTVSSLKAEADNCMNENVNTGRKLSGDRITYGQDKTW